VALLSGLRRFGGAPKAEIWLFQAERNLKAEALLCRVNAD
jgi:hypothetical protein